MAVEWISQQWLATWKHRQSAEENPQDGYDYPATRQAVDHVRRVAVEDLMLSQEDKPKKHWSDSKILHETAILHSSLHRIIQHNL